MTAYQLDINPGGYYDGVNPEGKYNIYPQGLAVKQYIGSRTGGTSVEPVGNAALNAMSTRKPIIRIEFDEAGGIEVSREGMRYDSFAQYKIFRPRLLTERTVLGQESDHFLSAVNPGRYTKAAEINSDIQHLCKFYGQMLEENLPKLASRDYIEFLLSQYDESFKVEMAARQSKLSQRESEE